jgi:hypothetical protein
VTALEALSLICPPTAVRSLRQSSQARALSHARTCYGHLAGVIGVLLLDALLDRQWLTGDAGGYCLTPAGQRSLQDLGVDVNFCGDAEVCSRSPERPVAVSRSPRPVEDRWNHWCWSRVAVIARGESTGDPVGHPGQDVVHARSSWHCPAG